jgi:peptidoglycan DL-endopeptidase CwlO
VQGVHVIGRTGLDEPRSRIDQRPGRNPAAADPRRGRRTAPTHRPATESTAPVVRRSRSRVLLSALVMLFAGGLVATLALPSYAIDPNELGNDDIAGRSVAKDGEQEFTAAKQAAVADLARDNFSATSSATLLRQAYATQFAAYTGPSVEDFLKNPPNPDFSLDAVYSTALQYRGVPYVFGGANPSGFDCSGYIMFVYAQYGIALPHSVHAQDAIGTPISEEDAQPGDVVVFNDDSHDGFYAGNGLILHAPYPGASVRVQKIWTSNVHFVRFGI